MLGAHDSLLYARVETVLASEITDGDLRTGNHDRSSDEEMHGSDRVLT